MTDRYYILEGKKVTTVPDVISWGRWMETADRKIARDTLKGPDGKEVMISTVFLGLDHSFSRAGPPVLYETMVFGGPFDGTCERATTYEEAETKHREILEQVLAAIGATT